MRKLLSVLLGIGTLFSLCSCTEKNPNEITLEQMLHTQGVPTAIASGYEIDKDTQLSTITLYGINQPVTAETINGLKPGQFVVFSKERGFNRDVSVHFADMHDPTVYSGSTLYGSLFTNGTDLTIFRITEDRNAELQYLNFVSVVYLEVGDKGHLVRVIPKM